MLVSAAMAERPRATASSRSRPAPAAQAPDQRRLSTARVSTTQGAHAADGARRSELPGWFWGALGFLTVLVVGLSVVFFIGQTSTSSLPAAASASPAAPAAAAALPEAAPSAPAAARAGTPSMQVEQMAPPPPAIDQVPQAPAPPVAKQKAAAGHPIKVARSPSGGAKAAGASPAAAAAPAAEKDDNAEEELPKVKAPPSGRPSSEDEANDR